MTISKFQLRLLEFERLVERVWKAWEARCDTSGEVYVGDRVSEYRDLWRAVAEKKGAKFAVLADDLWEVDLNGKKTRILNYKMEFDNPITLEIAGKKPLVYRMLADKGLPVPEHKVFRLDSLELAQDFLGSHPKGCVIKPANGTSSGLGVTTHTLTRREVHKAAIRASLYDRELLIEPMVPGESYRLLVLDGEMIHAVRRRGPRLNGDGVSTVAKLIRADNERRRERGEELVETDRDCLFTLAYQNLSVSSIPSKGHAFVVQSVHAPRHKRTEVRTVYNEAVTDLVCDSLKKNAESAAATLSARFIGVDIITTDPTVPLGKSGGAIIEVNTTPGLHHHYDLRSEKFPEPAIRVIDALFQQ